MIAGFVLCIFLVAYGARGATCPLANPLPASCGTRGRVQPSQLNYYPCGAPQIVASLGECALMCSRHRVNATAHQENPFENNASLEGYCFCEGIAYDSKAKLCQLGQLAVSDAVQSTPKGTQKFYDNECFDCPGSFCGQPLGAQLLDNPGFELPLLGPWVTRAGTISNNGSNSARAFECDLGFSCTLSQSPNMCDGSMYKFEFDFLGYRTDKHPINFTLQADVGGFNFLNAYSYIQNAPANPTGSWTSVRGYVPIQGTHVGPQFHFGVSNGRSRAMILVDNVGYSRVPAPTVKKGAKSLLKNGGFESGALEPGWTQDLGDGDTPFDVVSPGLGGSQYALFYNFKSTGSTTSPKLNQAVATTSNTSYLVSFNTSGGAATVLVTVGAIDAVGAATTSVVVPAGKASFAIPVVAATSNTLLGITFRDGGNTVTVDNIKMREISADGYYG